MNNHRSFYWKNYEQKMNYEQIVKYEQNIKLKFFRKIY